LKTVPSANAMPTLNVPYNILSFIILNYYNCLEEVECSQDRESEVGATLSLPML